MITGLANLGPSLKGSSGLGENLKSSIADKNRASDFDQILNSKSDKDVRTNFAGKDPASIANKGIQKWNPEKAEAAAAKDSSVNEPRMAPKENTGREEQGSVKAKKVGDKSGKKSDGSSQSREQVMLQFMDSMESEFSIPPARIAEAMANLSESDQLSSPEDSASKVISQLNLPTDQEQKAYALYMGMLAQLKLAGESNPKSMATPAFMASAAVPVGMLNAKEKRTQLNSSLDQLSQKFFMKPQAAPEVPAMGMQDSVQMSKMMDMNSLGDQSTYAAMAPRQSQMPSDKGFPVMDKSPSVGVEEQVLAEMDKMDPESAEGQKLAKALAALSVAAAALNDSAPAVDANQQTAQVAPMNFSQMAKAAQEEQGFGESSNDQKSSHGDQSMFSQHVAGQAVHSAKAEAASSVNPQFAGALAIADQTAGAGAQDNQANIQQIMKQAQYMIKKGGGESKIQMNPEGLGEIHMKVVVNDGKVNLEMTADNKETKKLIESSLNDLKTNLSQHKLSVDQVRVDVSSQSANDKHHSDSQQNFQRQLDMKQEHSQNQQRDQARDFWSQFQDGGTERRSNFFETPGIRAYGGSRKVEPLTPGSVSGAQEKRYSGSGKGRGIDLVA